MQVFQVFLVVLALSLASLDSARAASTYGGGVSGQAASRHVDGISDQSLPAWDGDFSGSYFAGVFRDAWVGNSAHVRLARYVVQWNAMSGGYPRYRAEFESWLADVASMGLESELALTSYDGLFPATPGEYRTALERILARSRALAHPIDYLEAWNEPNNQGREPAEDAAHFTNEASAVCGQGYGCTVIAGNLEDSPGVAAYEDEYVKALDPVPTIWGVHPYYSVEEQSEAPYLNFRDHLPDGGAGERVWFTEISARKCSDFDGGVVENGELGQAQRAAWLVNTLMRNARPEHVFYYEFLLRDHRQPSCQAEGSDGALYVPDGDPAEPDRPRPAASYIWGDGSVPRGYDGAFIANPAEAALTGGVYL